MLGPAQVFHEKLCVVTREDNVSSSRLEGTTDPSIPLGHQDAMASAALILMQRDKFVNRGNAFSLITSVSSSDVHSVLLVVVANAFAFGLAPDVLGSVRLCGDFLRGVRLLGPTHGTPRTCAEPRRVLCARDISLPSLSDINHTVHPVRHAACVCRPS